MSPTHLRLRLHLPELLGQRHLQVHLRSLRQQLLLLLLLLLRPLLFLCPLLLLLLPVLAPPLFPLLLLLLLLPLVPAVPGAWSLKALSVVLIQGG